MGKKLRMLSLMFIVSSLFTGCVHARVIDKEIRGTYVVDEDGKSELDSNLVSKIGIEVYFDRIDGNNNINPIVANAPSYLDEYFAELGTKDLNEMDVNNLNPRYLYNLKEVE